MDRVMIRRGVVIWPEIKREGEPLRKAQKLRRKEMESFGALCYAWDNLDDAKKVLR